MRLFNALMGGLSMTLLLLVIAFSLANWVTVPNTSAAESAFGRLAALDGEASRRAAPGSDDEAVCWCP